MAGEPVDIRFTRGIDAQNDARVAEQPFLLAADNVYFDCEAGPKKRDGYSLLPNQKSSATASNGTVLLSTSTVAHSDELLSFDDSNLYAYSNTTGGWIDRGYCVPAASTQRPASPVSSNQTMCDAAAYNDAWELIIYQITGNASTIYFSIRDRVTGGYMRYNEVLAVAGSATPTPRIVPTTGGFLVIYQGAAGWYARPVGTNVMSSSLVGGEVRITTSTGIMDAAYDGQRYTVMALNDAPGSVTLFGLLPLGTVFATRVLSPIPSGAGTAISIVPYTQSSTASANVGRFLVTYACTPTGIPTSTTAGLAQFGLDIATGASLFSPSTIYPSGVVAIKQIAASVRPNGLTVPDIATVTVSRVAGGGAGAYTDTGQYATQTYTSGLTATAIAPNGNMVLASKTFFYNNQPYAFMARYVTRTVSFNYSIANGNVSTTAPTSQGALYLVNLYTQSICAFIGYGVTVATDAAPTAPLIGAGGVYEIPAAKTVKLLPSAYNSTQFDTVNYYYLYGVKFTNANQLPSAQLGDTRVFAGGVNRFYDGASLVEHSFLHAPEILTVTTPSAPATLISPAGVYQVCAVYEWTDRQGNLHRSAPGPAVAITLTDAFNAKNDFAVTVSHLAATAKANVAVVLYMTAVNGTLFYRYNSATADYSSPTGTQIRWSYFASGALSSETLYTTGGILPNDPPPSSAALAASRNRIFVAGGEESDVLYYSKAYVKGNGVGFSLAFSKRVASVPGAITALAVMDDKVVVFKARSILYFYGQNGPGPDGSNDDFAPTQILTTEMGCVSKSSVLATSDGVYFQSEKGIYLLSRSMTLTFVGQPIAPLVRGKTITSATLTAGQTTIRFGTLDGSAFIYHYRVQAPYGGSLQCGQWTTFSNYKQYQATIYKGVYAFSRADGRVCLEQAGAGRDDTQPVSFTLRTAWLRAGTLLQWGAFTDLALLGSYQAPHALLVRVYRDYRSSTDTVLKYDAKLATTTTQWGSDPTWGGQATFGGYADDTYVARWRLPNACAGIAAISFSISDAGIPGADLAASCQILGINLLGQAQNELAHIGDRKRQ